MIQCVSDTNPYDDEPDVVEEAEEWLKRHPDSRLPIPQCDQDYRWWILGTECDQDYAKRVIEGLLGYIKDEI